MSACLCEAWSAQISVPVDDESDWAVYGHGYDNEHYSRLSDINATNVRTLGLVWWVDIPGIVLATSTPLEVAGRLYFATGYSVLRAVDATDGRLLWIYDPKVSRVAGQKLHNGWGIRGIAYWNDRIYVGTHDGRLIAIDAQTGRPLWSVRTVSASDRSIITGPPLAFDGRVLIGFGGGDLGAMRGYVTAYDALTGRRLWRFFTVPGDPRHTFENAAMAAAARTWTGQWWTQGGGGTVWNAITYDAQLCRVYIGTGNGVPTQYSPRSPGGGDNWFLSSIVALDATTGAYLWHYQTNPAETWDFDAAEDIELGELTIAGRRRRVLFQASKNGFVYVIDRDTGQLISAEKFAKATWAQRIDRVSGRPVETPDARTAAGMIHVWPSPYGAHGPQAMAFNPLEKLIYIPTLELSANSDRNSGHGFLLAWNPVTGRLNWRVELPGLWNGGVLTTSGSLVFQGNADGKLVAYEAKSGKMLWSFDARVSIVGAPITYEVFGRQFVSVMAGSGGFASKLDPRWDAQTQHRRVLTFALSGRSQLPSVGPEPERKPIVDPTFEPRVKMQQRGVASFQLCVDCHGEEAIAGGMAPDLRGSFAILSEQAFSAIVRKGALLEQGMPKFEELSRNQAEDIRQYLRARAWSQRQLHAGGH